MDVATILGWLAAILMLIGALFTFVGGLGALRMPDFYTRMHAASLTDSAGPIFILIGLMLISETWLVAIKVFTILVFLLITGPTASNALASASLLAGNKPGLANDRSEAE